MALIWTIYPGTATSTHGVPAARIRAVATSYVSYLLPLLQAGRYTRQRGHYDQSCAVFAGRFSSQQREHTVDLLPREHDPAAVQTRLVHMGAVVW